MNNNRGKAREIERKGPPAPFLPGKRHRGTGWIRGKGPEGEGLYEVSWEIEIGIEGFVEIKHKARRLNTDGT